MEQAIVWVVVPMLCNEEGGTCIGEGVGLKGVHIVLLVVEVLIISVVHRRAGRENMQLEKMILHSPTPISIHMSRSGKNLW
jgi:hypothetical protein